MYHTQFQINNSDTMKFLTSANHLTVTSCHNTYIATITAVPSNDVEWHGLHRKSAIKISVILLRCNFGLIDIKLYKKFLIIYCLSCYRQQQTYCIFCHRHAYRVYWVCPGTSSLLKIWFFCAPFLSLYFNRKFGC